MALGYCGTQTHFVFLIPSPITVSKYPKKILRTYFITKTDV